MHTVYADSIGHAARDARVPGPAIGAPHTHCARRRPPAASGIKHFDEMLDEAARRTPQRRLVDAYEVGRMALLLASSHAFAITGEVVHFDAGHHIEGTVVH